MFLCKINNARGLCVLVACLALPLSAFAETMVNRTADLPLFAIADVWPWGYDESGRPAGLLVTLTDRLLAKAQVEARVELRPHLRAIDGIANGTADFAYLFADPTLNPDAISLGIIIESFTLLTVLASPSQGAPKLEDFTGRHVGFIRGTYYGEAFANLDAIKIPAENGAQALKLLQRGRVDAIVTSDQAIYNAAKQLGIPPSQILSTAMTRTQVGHLYLSHLSPYQSYAEPLRQALNQLREEGFLQQLFNLPQP